jgi:predicted small secreted protein
MRRLTRLVPVLLLVAQVLLAGCAAWTGRGAADRPRAKARGAEIIVLAGTRTHFFENRSPHCLAYKLPGEWDFGAQPATLRSPDGGRVVSLTLHRHPAGSDGVSHTLASFIADAEQDWSGPVPSTIGPFEASRPGAVILRFEDVVITPATAGRTIGTARAVVGQTVRLPLRVVAPLVPGFTLVATVFDVADAREILDTLEVTDEPQCWRDVIRRRFPGVLA